MTTPQQKDPKELLAELRKQQIAAHQLWLEHPTTQLYIKFLQNHRQAFIDNLCLGILVKSDKENEDKLRASIRTCEALLKVISDSNSFVEQTTKK